MRILSAVLATGLAAGLSAQTQTLTVAPMGVGLTYSQPGANFFDLVVTSPVITLRALEIPCQEPAGTVGTIELWWNTNSTTHVGNEQLAAAPATSGDPSGWELLTSGDYTSAGFAVLSQTCQSAFTVNVPNTELTMGTYAFAIVYTDIAHQFFGVTTWPPAAGTFADGNIEVTNGTTQATAWTVAPLNAFTFGNPPVAYQGTVADFGITYDIGSVPHACASVSSFGQGSVEQTASFFDLIEDANNVSATLQGNSILLTNTGTGYVVSPGTATFRPNSGNETAVPAVDDGENQITMPNLPVIVPTETGPITIMDLYIHSNGYISTAPQSALFFVPVDPQSAMDADATAWFGAYHDFNPMEVGSGQIIWEEDLGAQPNPTLYVTWDNVESYPANVANPTIFQYQFDLVTGDVSIVWELVDATGGSTFAGGDDTMIGWSPAGPSPDPEEFDYTTLVAIVAQLPEVFGLALEVVGDPLVGGSIDLVTSNEIGTSIGVNLLSESLAFPVPGFDLSVLGAPLGTVAYLDINGAILNTIDNANLQLTIPIANIPSLAGIEIYSQSFWFDLPSLLGGQIFNGLLSSNGIRFVVGNF